ncbi:MAG: hypothetical protein ACK559_00400, partial [bacterium]
HPHPAPALALEQHPAGARAHIGAEAHHRQIGAAQPRGLGRRGRQPAQPQARRRRRALQPPHPVPAPDALIGGLAQPVLLHRDARDLDQHHQERREVGARRQRGARRGRVLGHRTSGAGPP